MSLIDWRLHFLGNRAKRVNDEIWEELSYEFVKKKLSSENAPITHEAVLGHLLAQITDLSDIRTGPGSDNIIMAKTIAAVRNENIYSVVCQNPPKQRSRSPFISTLVCTGVR